MARSSRRNIEGTPLGTLCTIEIGTVQNRLNICGYYEGTVAILQGISVHQALRRLLLQGALRVVLVAATTAGVVGFLSLIARASQLPGQTLADAKPPSRACMPSHCRAKSETVLRNEKR
jgi:hypothetical protein